MEAYSGNYKIIDTGNIITFDENSGLSIIIKPSMTFSFKLLIDFEENDVVCMWMKNTFIGLDIVFINEDMKVVWIECDAIPLNEESLCSIEPVKYALEINSGMVKEYDIQIGDTITFEKDKFKE